MATYLYRFGASAVSSTIELDELDLVSDRAPTIALTITRGEVTTPDTWQRSWQARDGSTTHRLGRHNQDYVLDLACGITCAVNEALDRIVVSSNHLGAALARALVHQVFPLVFAHKGALLIHASAVVVDGCAVALFGPSAAGKSTLAAALVGRGAELLGDDALWLDDTQHRRTCRGTYRGVWLSRRSCDALGIPYEPQDPNEKHLVLRDTAQPNSAPLRALVWLYDSDDEDDVAIETNPMPASEVYFALYDHLFQLDPADRARATRVFARLTDTARNVPGWRLKAPYEFGQLDTACSLVEMIARTSCPRGSAP